MPSCLICGEVYDPLSAESQLDGWIEEIKGQNLRTDEEILQWVLQLNTQIHDDVLCGSCFSLLADLRDYEVKVIELRTELLKRHRDWIALNRRETEERKVPTLVLKLPKIDLTSGPLRRSSRLSAGTTPSGENGKENLGKRAPPAGQTTTRGRRKQAAVTEVVPENLIEVNLGEDAGAKDEPVPAEGEDDLPSVGDDAEPAADLSSESDDEENHEPKPKVKRTRRRGSKSKPVNQDDGDSSGSEYVPPVAYVTRRVLAPRGRGRGRGRGRIQTEKTYRRMACNICGRSYAAGFSLATHKRLAHGPGMKCTKCGKGFATSRLLYDHLAEAHDVRDFKCEHCGMGFAKRNMLNKHLRKEQRKRKGQERLERLKELKCSVCDFRPELPKQRVHEKSVRDQIKDHEFKQHGLNSTENPETVDVDSLYVCDCCGTTFSCRRALQKHKNKHKPKKLEEEKTYVQCEICGKSVREVGLKSHQVAVHMQGDTDDYIDCEYCGKKFPKLAWRRMRSHVEKQHLMTVQYPCLECKRIFSHKRGLDRHVMHVHRMKFECDTCGEKYPTVWKRDRHRAEAHNLYDFPCPHCDKKYFRQAELEIHVRRIHTLQLRYKCAVCDTRSEERRKLLNHEYTAHGLHTAPLPENNPEGRLPYPCTDCTLVYACGLAVKKHAMEQHQIKLNIYGRRDNPNKYTTPRIRNRSRAAPTVAPQETSSDSASAPQQQVMYPSGPPPAHLSAPFPPGGSLVTPTSAPLDYTIHFPTITFDIFSTQT